MRKATYLDQLESRWFDQRLALGRRVFTSAGKPDKAHWDQIIYSHRRRAFRIYGKKPANRASRVANELSNLEMFCGAVRNNRKLSGMDPQVVTVRNGKIHKWSD